MTDEQIFRIQIISLHVNYFMTIALRAIQKEFFITRLKLK